MNKQRAATRKSKVTKAGAAAPQSTLVTVVLMLMLSASVIWGMLHFATYFAIWLIALDLDGYRPARFVVQDVVYQKVRKGPDRYYAKGQIDGRFDEVVSLHGVAPVVNTREALEKHFSQQPVTLDVMFNPKRTTAMINQDSLRVQPSQERFVEKYRNSAWLGAFNVLLSIAVATATGLSLRQRSAKRRKR